MRKEALGEVLMDELKAIREYVQDVPIIKKTVEQIDHRLGTVEADVKTIKAVVTDQSRELKEHQSKLNILKQKIA